MENCEMYSLLHELQMLREELKQISCFIGKATLL